ncbi:hypothetical protein CPB86DRAFT_801740 [Serendipita vermifera]|nr:hypothetical protein CPB86DRAFT_801740 [Serendipita vermifera]
MLALASTLAFAASGARFVAAEPTPLEPSGSSVFNEGGNCTILWEADTTGVWTTMNIELMTGDNFNQVHLRTVATVDGTDTENHSFSYPCLAVEPNSPIYFYKFTSPATSDILFTTRFTIADAEGNVTPANMTQTATNGDVIRWGTGTLEDQSLIDEPPTVGTATPTSAPTSGGSSQTSRSGGSTGSGTRTATTTATSSTQTGAARAQSYPVLGSAVIGALGAFVATLF